jgi:hypothetical protein
MVVGMIPVEPEFPQSLVLLLRESGWIATWELIRAWHQYDHIKTDFRFYGSLYQWGRASDGHQIIRWNSSTSGTPLNGSTGTQSANRPVSSLFITSGRLESTQNDGLWQQAASQQSLSCWFSRSYSQRWGGDDITNSATAFEKLKLVEAGQPPTLLQLTGTGDSGLLELVN